MTPQDPKHPDFERDLERLTAAYRTAADEEPPALLDQAVLNAARRAAAHRPERPWSFGWMHALATTALVVLGIAVVMQQQPRDPTASSGEGGERMIRQEQAVPASTPPAADDQAPVMEALQALPAPEATAKRETAEQAVADRSRQAMEPVPPPVPAAEGEPRAAQAALETEAVGRLAAGQNEPARDAPAGIASPSLEAPEEEPPLPSAAADDQRPGDPETWLAHILELKRAGRPEWRQQLEAFTARWPDHPLPPELAD